jgi:hypothetical protein
MTLPAWPSTVPTDATDGWQMPQMYTLPIATQMDGGNQRVRSRPGSNVASVSYPLMPLTMAQWDDLNTFIRTTLGNGASRFTMSILTGDVYETKTCQIDGTKSPTAQRIGDYMSVVLPLFIYGM